jgi:CRP-like cAMP-binding protein
MAALTEGEVGDKGGGGDIASVQHHAKNNDEPDGHAIHPRSPFAMIVALVPGVCLLYTVVFAPYTLAFYWFAELCEGTPYDGIDMGVEIIFLIEIILTFAIGRYKDGEYIGRFRQVAREYVMSGQLFFDCLTSIPIAWFEQLQRLAMCSSGDVDISSSAEGAHPPDSSESNLTSVLRFVKIIKPLRLLRLLRILKLLNHKAFKVIKDSLAIEPDMIRLFNVAVMVFIACHFAGCLCWLVKSLSSPPEVLNKFLQDQFIVGKNGYPLGGWFCGTHLPPGDEECEMAAVKDVYILCFYFSMTTLTTVGYGDISGTNSADRIYCCFLQIFGTIVFATIMNQLSMVLDNLSFHAQQKEFRLTKCRRFLNKHYVNKKLARQILDWAVFQYQNEVEWNDTNEIMEMLPRSMRRSLALSLHEKMLSTVPIFYRSGTEFISEVALALIPERYNANESVVLYGQLTDRMHVILMGCCVMRALGGRHITTFTVGDYFGEFNVVRPHVSKTNVVCVEFSELWCLNKAALDVILVSFPHIKRLIDKMSYDTYKEEDAILKRLDHLPRRIGKIQRGTVSNGLLRGLAVNMSEDGVLLPSGKLIEKEDDSIAILRWSFIVVRNLRRLYALDKTQRMFNRISTFGNKVFLQGEEYDDVSTADEEEHDHHCASQEHHRHSHSSHHQSSPHDHHHMTQGAGFVPSNFPPCREAEHANGSGSYQGFAPTLPPQHPSHALAQSLVLESETLIQLPVMNHKDAEDDDKKLSKPKKQEARRTEASSHLPATLGASTKLPLSATRDASTKVTIQIPRPSEERY